MKNAIAIDDVYIEFQDILEIHGCDHPLAMEGVFFDVLCKHVFTQLDDEQNLDDRMDLLTHTIKRLMKERHPIN